VEDNKFVKMANRTFKDIHESLVAQVKITSPSLNITTQSATGVLLEAHIRKSIYEQWQLDRFAAEILKDFRMDTRNMKRHDQILIARPELVMKRTATRDLVAPLQCSTALLKELDQLWMEVIFFDWNSLMDQKTILLIDTLEHVRRLVTEDQTTEGRTRFLKNCLIGRGGKIGTHSKPSEQHYYNAQKWMMGTRLVWADVDDHAVAGIKVWKVSTFSELQAKRAARSPW